MNEGATVASAVAFVVLTLLVVAAIVAGVGLASRGIGEDAATVRARVRSAILVAVAWLGVTGGAAATGYLAHFDRLPPPLMALVGATLVTTTTLALTGFGARMAAGLSVPMLVGFQAFRLPLEILLHRLGVENAIPPQMTWDGMNFDVVTGVTAIAVAALAAAGRAPRWLLLAWNALGLVLLWVIVTVAILSTPVPFRVFLNDPANTIITRAPWVWLPTVLVQAAWFGHLVLARRLRAG